jgi:hypothetical protein
MALVADQRAFAPNYDFDRRWREAAKSLTDEQRQWLQGLRDEMHKALFKHLFATSFFGCLLLFTVLERRSTKAQRRPYSGLRPGGDSSPQGSIL